MKDFAHLPFTFVWVSLGISSYHAGDYAFISVKRCCLVTKVPRVLISLRIQSCGSNTAVEPVDKLQSLRSPTIVHYSDRKSPRSRRCDMRHPQAVANAQLDKA